MQLRHSWSEAALENTDATANAQLGELIACVTRAIHTHFLNKRKYLLPQWIATSRRFLRIEGD